MINWRGRIWKAIYFQRFGTEPLYKAETECPVAVESPDHKWPRGTAFDNSSNRNFNLKLYAHFNFRTDLRVMDLGCSGGGFVKSFLEDGYIAVGLEGSDWSKKLRSGEWDTCPHHLLTCDITSRFQVTDRGGGAMTFHCITAWEVLEHIPADILPALIDNIARHLTPDGIFVASVDTAPDANPITGAVYHATLQPKSWWLAQFAKGQSRRVRASPLHDARLCSRPWHGPHRLGSGRWRGLPFGAAARLIFDCIFAFNLLQ